MPRQRPIVFVWENFGPIHAVRADAVGQAFKGKRPVIGIELSGRSGTYDWISETGSSFQKQTLFPGTNIETIGVWRRLLRTLRACLKQGRADFFLCHYEHPATLMLAWILRLLGNSVYVMNDSKFDDKPRKLSHEVLKAFFYLPYQGAIGSGLRSRDYLRFLGIRQDRIASHYNALSISRVREMSGTVPAPDGLAFSDRHFTIVARFVEKKNLPMALDAYASYVKLVKDPRPLHLCGSGRLEASLREQVSALGLQERVVFRGFVQIDEVAKILARTLALLLPSIEEQFGNVVIEAQAMGLPVILSDNCGARDLLVRSGVNGFVIEPDNPRGMAYFMSLLSEDEQLWRRMALATRDTVMECDVRQFVDGIVQLALKQPGRQRLDGALAVTRDANSA